MSAARILYSEIKSLKCRDFGITCSTTTSWVANMIIGATFLSLLGSIVPAGTFCLYTGFNLVFSVIIVFLTPEN